MYPLQNCVFTVFQTDILDNSILGISFYVGENNHFSLKKHGLKIRASHLPRALSPSGLSQREGQVVTFRTKGTESLLGVFPSGSGALGDCQTSWPLAQSSVHIVHLMLT